MSKYAWIQNKNTAQTVKWQPWDFQIDLLDSLLKEDEIVILKARQLGISWLVSGYGLWKALFSDSAKILFLSQGEEEAWDMVAKARFIWEHLPEFLRLPLKHDTRSVIDFKGNNSEIRALPSTDKAGRGTDATLVVRDELAQHPYGRENFTAISPAIDSGGQLVDLSTIDKLDFTNHFTDRVNRAKKQESGAKLIFLGWKLRPVRQEGMSLEDWFELRIKPKYTPLEIEQEYPATIEDALKPSETKAFFDRDAVADMLLQTSEPITTDEINLYDGMVKIWKLPQVGRRYVVFSDPSDGAEDPHATIVMDASTSEWVAISHGKVKAEICAQIHDSLVRFYNNAYNSGEGNARAGGKFELTLEQLETPSIAPRRNADGKIVTLKGGETKKGWYTTEPIREVMLDDYEEAIRRRLITIHYREAIEEHKFFMRLERGKPQASKGAHDDFVMAGAGAWRLQKYLPVSTSGWSRPYRRGR